MFKRTIAKKISAHLGIQEFKTSNQQEAKEESVI